MHGNGGGQKRGAYLFNSIVKFDKGLLEVQDVRILCFLGHGTKFGQQVLQPFPATPPGLFLRYIRGIRVRLLILGLRPDVADAPSTPECSAQLSGLGWQSVRGAKLPGRPALMER